MTCVVTAYGQRADLLGDNGTSCFLELTDMDSGRACHIVLEDEYFKEFIAFVHVEGEEEPEEPEGPKAVPELTESPDEF